MAYIVIEGNIARHRKFLKAGPAAAWLWVCGLSYCQQGLTDGVIDGYRLDELSKQHWGAIQKLPSLTISTEDPKK